VVGYEHPRLTLRGKAKAQLESGSYGLCEGAIIELRGKIEMIPPISAAREERGKTNAFQGATASRFG